MTETPKQSDQLPEEAPAEVVHDDVPGADEGAAREAARTSELGHRDLAEQNEYERVAGGDADLDDEEDDEDGEPEELS